MAKQKGIIKIEGTMDDITFYQTQDGFMAKKKTVIPKERIMTDERFERTRENMSEFSRAGLGTKSLRSSIEEMLKDCSDNRVSSRLNATMMKIIKADPVNARGQRKLTAGPLAMLKGFDFNIHAGFTQTFKPAVAGSIDRATGKHIIDIAPFVPANMVMQPEGTTHFRFIAACSEVNFDDDHLTVKSFFTGDSLPINNLPTAPISIVFNMTAASTNPIFLFIGIKFHQEVNGVEYALKNESFNAFCVLGVDQVV